MKSRPRIVIDARALTHPQPGGFRSHVRGLAWGLRESGIGEGAELIFYVDRPPTPEQERILPPGAGVRVLSPNRLKTDFRLFAAQVRRDAPDLVHGTVNYLPPNLSARTTLFVHDAFAAKPDLAGKSLRQRAMTGYWGALSRSAVRRAARLLTGSRHAAGELATTLRLPEAAFAVVYHGILPLSPCRDAPRSANQLLAFASPDPRKNIGALLSALAQWQGDESPPLTLISSDARTTAQLQTELQNRKLARVQIVTRPDDAEVARLYARAAAFVFPSRAEGFGLPPLEAMALGCPVVSSSASAMPEILGDIPYYFAPDRPDELAAQLREALTDRGGVAARIARGRAHAATFTCRRMAEDTAAVWREALT